MRCAVVVVPDEAGWVDLMDIGVHLVISPVEAWVLILIPLSVQPDSLCSVVPYELGELCVHEGIVGVPATVALTPRTSSCTSNGVVVLTVPV